MGSVHETQRDGAVAANEELRVHRIPHALRIDGKADLREREPRNARRHHVGVCAARDDVGTRAA